MSVSVKRLFDEGVCPISKAPLRQRRAWMKSDTYYGRLGLIHDNIIVSFPSGVTGIEEGRGFFRRLQEVVDECGLAEEGFVVIENYSEHVGANREARANYIRTMSELDGLRGIIFHDVSKAFALSIRLGRILSILNFQVEIVANYRRALDRAFQILNKTRIDFVPDFSKQPDWTIDVASERIGEKDEREEIMDLLNQVDWEKPCLSFLQSISSESKLRPLAERIAEMKYNMDCLLKERTRRTAELMARRENSQQLTAELQKALDDSCKHKAAADRVATENLALGEEVLDSHREVFRSLSGILEQRGGNHPGHLERISVIVERLCRLRGEEESRPEAPR